MLRLSDVLSGLVCGNRFVKTLSIISTENRNRKPLTIETMGRGDLGEWLRGNGIYITFRYTGLSN